MGWCVAVFSAVFVLICSAFTAAHQGSSGSPCLHVTRYDGPLSEPPHTLHMAMRRSVRC